MLGRKSKQGWETYNWTLNSLRVIRDLKRHILTDYREINHSYTQPPTSIVSNDIGDLLLVARYLTNLADQKSATHESEQLPPINIDVMTIAQIISFHNDVFTPAVLANLAIEHDEILWLCLQAPLKHITEDTFFYSKGIRNKIATQFMLALNSSDSITELQRSLWNAFCDGTISDKLLRYAHEQKMSQALLSRATTLAFSTTEKPEELSAAFSRYLEWSNEFNWYNVLSTLWSYIKWAISYGENYSSQVIALLNPEKLQLHRNTLTLNNLYFDVGSLKQVALPDQSSQQQLVEDIDELKQHVQQLNPEHINTVYHDISSQQERLESEIRLLREMIELTPTASKSTISELQKQQFMSALHNGQQQLNTLKDQMNILNRRMSGVETTQQSWRQNGSHFAQQQTVTRAQAARLADAFRNATTVPSPSTPPYRGYSNSVLLSNTPPAPSTSILADTPSPLSAK